MDEGYIKKDDKNLDKAVYFVAYMSKKLLIEKDYIGNAGTYFGNPDYIIKTSESNFLETRCDLSAWFLENNENLPLSAFQINIGLAQAALGSLLAEHKHIKSVDQPLLIMPETNRTAILIAMGRSESTHDR